MQETAEASMAERTETAGGQADEAGDRGPRREGALEGTGSHLGDGDSV